MEGDNNIDMGGGSGGSLSSSRWNPTKEQINMLESLYRQGIRTPTAEQIQQISGRLRAFGHIEGKNVFYWFQNHKARQRQKQKQERIAFINRYLHNSQPVFPPNCTSVVCGPYFLPRSDLGFYPQNTKVLLPGGSKRRSSSSSLSSTRTDQESTEKNRSTSAGSGYDPVLQQEYNIRVHTSNNNSYQNSGDVDDQETLALFPLHPTGILQGRTSAENSSTTAFTSSETSNGSTGFEGAVSDQPFFDFFTGKS
ncbi:hypothetical protein ACOSQ4_025113 [Xanthoceras sorbifolium]